MTYVITLSGSGKKFNCGGDEEILKAGLAAGVLMPFSCRSGMCRTCRGTVVSGQADHGRAHVLYLPESDRAQGLALLCCARPLSDMTIDVEEIDPSRGLVAKKLPTRVLESSFPSTDVAIITLGLPPNEPMLFRAGQFVDIILRNGSRRSYSIATTPRSEGVRQVELHIRHLPGGQFTDHVFNTMKVREIVQIEMPLGSFFLRDDSVKPMVLLASGTGFAPISSILHDCLERGITRPVSLYWGGRRKADLYMLEQVQKLARESPLIEIIPVLSEPSPDDAWTGRTGFVHRAVMDDFPDLSAYQVYACGAPQMVDAARQDFTALCQLDPQEFFADAFTNEGDKAKTLAPLSVFE